MGWEKVAIAIVSTKDPAHFRTTPGGYFHGMVTKARAGHLNLGRTLLGMRRANEPRPAAARGCCRVGRIWLRFVGPLVLAV